MSWTHSPQQFPHMQSPQPFSPHAGQISEGTITYTQTTDEKGNPVYHPFRAVRATYQTSSGLIHGMQWIPAEATAILPHGAIPAGREFADSWNAGKIDKWQREEEKRRKKEEKDVGRRLDKYRHEDDDLRRARERDLAERERRRSINAGPGGIPLATSPGAGIGGFVNPSYHGGATMPSQHAHDRKFSHGAADLDGRFRDLSLDRDRFAGPYDREKNIGGSGGANQTTGRPRTVSFNLGNPSDKSRPMGQNFGNSFGTAGPGYPGGPGESKFSTTTYPSGRTSPNPFGKVNIVPGGSMPFSGPPVSGRMSPNPYGDPTTPYMSSHASGRASPNPYGNPSMAGLPPSSHISGRVSPNPYGNPHTGGANSFPSSHMSGRASPKPYGNPNITGPNHLPGSYISGRTSPNPYSNPNIGGPNQLPGSHVSGRASPNHYSNPNTIGSNHLPSSHMPSTGGPNHLAGARISGRASPSPYGNPNIGGPNQFSGSHISGRASPKPYSNPNISGPNHLPSSHMPNSGGPNSYPSAHVSGRVSPNLYNGPKTGGPVGGFRAPSPNHVRSMTDPMIRSPSPFGAPQSSMQMYPKGHILEGQPIPRSRAPSPIGGMPGGPGFPSSVFSSNSTLVNFPGPTSPRTATPPAFRKPVNTAQSFAPFETMKIQDMNSILNQIPRMPWVLQPHDVQSEDWNRCMQDLAHAWTSPRPSQESGRVVRPSSTARYFIELWNTNFFLPRGVELILYKGRERRSGARYGQVDNYLPAHEDDGFTSDDSMSSLSDSDLGPSGDERFMARQYGLTPEVLEMRRREKARKAEKQRRQKEKNFGRREKKRSRGYALYMSCVPMTSFDATHGAHVGPPIPRRASMIGGAPPGW